MGAQRIHLFLSLLIGLVLAQSSQAQTFDLQVDVVLDTVLYDGFEGPQGVVPDGYRRYRLYAVLPDDDFIMLGLAADDISDPVIPAFGYDAPCGCYNWSLPPTESYHNAATINPALANNFPAQR